MMENNSKNKKQFILSLIGISLLILFSVGITLAFFNYTKVGSRNNVLNTANLSFYFEDSEWIWLENAFPISTEKALTLEVSGNGSDLTEVDGGIAQFKVVGGHNSGAIHYVVSLIKEDLTSTYTSPSRGYTIDPTGKKQLPDGAISINLQSSLENIHETTGLVNDTTKLLYPRYSFTPAYTGSYINTEGGVSIDKLPIGETNERIIGYGVMSGSNATRYFELRMWINDTVHIDTDLRTACQNSNSDETTYGQGYCNPTTEGLPEGIKYVYSTGEYNKLYYSNKIKVQTTDVTSGVIETVPPITKTLKLETTPLADNTTNFNEITTSSDSNLMLMKSTENSAYPIYYYRGNVKNNHLIFGGFCWRIVRTTETGGTKIIYDGVPSSGVCNNTGSATHIKEVIFNSDSDSPAYVGYKYGSVNPPYSSKSSSDLSSMGSIVYGKNITYQNGQYTLTDTITRNGANYSTDRTDTSTSGMQYHHYTCLNSSSTCSTVYYVYYLDYLMYYFSLTGGQTHLDLLNEMLENDGTEKSNVYKELNAWYSNNLLSYAKYLEDTVFCNDRSIADYGGWDINKSNTNGLDFGAHGRLETNKNPSLVCPNNNDKYTVSESNGNGELEYPIGLLTADEYSFAGAKVGSSNSSFYLNNGLDQWLLSPSYFHYNSASVFCLYSTGRLSGYDVYALFVLRPVVSLRPSITITSGNGSSSTPYIVGN